MGIPGLWDILRPAATRHSLSHLAREAVLKNKNNLRALTIGIDASIWIFHAQIPHHGENPFLRTIFYKITALLQQPVLPIFVFDGPDKPGRKRNRRVGGSFGTSDSRSRQFKELLDECGLEWWNAPGEAEAELAVMNRQGKIDAVLSDDVDALLFGALCLLRNNSPTLSGARGTTGPKSEVRSYDVYRASAVCELMTSKDGTKLMTDEDCRLAMVLIALLAGGDYTPEGVDSFGPVIAHGLAHAGFIDVLKLYKTDRTAFETELSFTHGRLIEELRTDSAGMIGRKNPARAKALADLDPSDVFSSYALEAYLSPSTSPMNDPSVGWPGFDKGEKSIRRGKARNGGRGDLEGFARACERFFEWGTKDIVVKKFATEIVGLYHSELVHTAREFMRSTPSVVAAPVEPAASQSDKRLGSTITSFFQEIRSSQSSQTKSKPSARPSTPEEDVADVKIISSRPDPTDPFEKDYRLVYQHKNYSDRVLSAMEGNRVDPKKLDAEMRAELGLIDKEAEDSDSTPPLPKDELRCWMPDYLVEGVWPDLVAEYEQKAEEKAKKAEQREARRLAKEASGIQVKKAKAKPPIGIDTQAFKQFFAPSDKSAIKPPASERSHTSKTPEVILQPTDSDSDIEFVGMVEKKVGRVKPSRRHCPTSSISSTASLPQLPSTPSTSIKKVNKTVAQKTVVVTKSPVSVRITTSPSEVSIEIIDLCSSEEETPKARRKGPLTDSHTNGSTPVTSRRQRSPKKKSKGASASDAEMVYSDSLVVVEVIGSPRSVRNRQSPKQTKETAAQHNDEDITETVVAETSRPCARGKSAGYPTYSGASFDTPAVEPADFDSSVAVPVGMDETPRRARRSPKARKSPDSAVSNTGRSESPKVTSGKDPKTRARSKYKYKELSASEDEIVVDATGTM